MEQHEALEMVVKEATPFGERAVLEARDAFLLGYTQHKAIHGSFKHLIMTNGVEYNRRMQKRILFQIEQGREAYQKYR